MGRKRKEESEKRIVMAITVPREFMEKLENRRKSKGFKNRSKMIKDMLESYMALVDK